VQSLVISGIRSTVKAVVGAQRHEAVGLDAVAPLEDAHDGRLQVVIAQAMGQASKVLGRADVAVEEHLLGLVGIDPMEPLPEAERRTTNIQLSVSSPRR